MELGRLKNILPKKKWVHWEELKSNGVAEQNVKDNFQQDSPPPSMKNERKKCFITSPNDGLPICMKTIKQ